MSLPVPPPSLKIKRRRDEEPLEALYIQDAAREGDESLANPRKTKQRRLLDGCRVDYVFKLQPAGPPGTIITTAAQTPNSKSSSKKLLRDASSARKPVLSRQVPPVVRVSEPSAETGRTRLGDDGASSTPERIVTKSSSSEESLAIGASADATLDAGKQNPRITQARQSRLSGRVPELLRKSSSSSLLATEPLRPRRFHLSQQSLQSPGSSRPSSRIGKRSRVAVFVEKELVRKIRSRPDLVGLGSAPPISSKQTSVAVTVSTESKTELDRPIKDWDLESPAVLAELESWTKDEIEADAQLERSQQNLAFKPKRPPTRIKDREAAASSGTKRSDLPSPVNNQVKNEAVGTTEDEDTNDGEFVYDTYIRVPVATVPKALTDPLKSYGILALSSLEMEQWEALYAEGEEDSDEARRREAGMNDESDENAEDWAGNDYPDEEDSFGASTDEELIDGFDGLGFGTSSYSKRKKGTTADDEEWDLDDFEEEDVGAWSTVDGHPDQDEDADADVDEAGAPPWKRHRLP